MWSSEGRLFDLAALSRRRQGQDQSESEIFLVDPLEWVAVTHPSVRGVVDGEVCDGMAAVEATCNGIDDELSPENISP